jgi:hypothetical protein
VVGGRDTSTLGDRANLVSASDGVYVIAIYIVLVIFLKSVRFLYK